MTITQLEYVVAVATYRSFIAAAEKCFVTQPTLSMQIQKLEDELGIRLFDRNKHPIAVTAIGEEIVAQAKEVLSSVSKIQDVIEARQSTISGLLRIAVIPTIAPYLLPDLLESYAKTYPDVVLKAQEMETKAIIKALKNNEIDIAILSTPLEENSLREYPVFYEQFVAYFSPDEKALEKREIVPEDIDMERLWLLSEGHCMRNQIIDLCSEQIRKMQATKPYRYESSNVETLRKMVDKNGGLTILPELAISEFTEDTIERVRFFEAPAPVREVSLVTTGYYARKMLLKSLQDEILKIVPESMHVQKKNRRVLRIQSAKL